MTMETDDPAIGREKFAELRGEVVWWRALAITALVVGATVAFLLVREVRSHRADNARMDVLQQQIQAMGNVLKGSRVDDLPMVGVDGGATRTDFASAPLTLIILLSGHCAACESAAPAWAQVAARAAREGIVTWVVVIDAGERPEDSLRWAGMTPWAVPGAERTWMRGVPGVPAAVLVDSAGVVRETWVRPIGPAEVEGVVASVQLELQRRP